MDKQGPVNNFSWGLKDLINFYLLWSHSGNQKSFTIVFPFFLTLCPILKISLVPLLHAAKYSE